MVAKKTPNKSGPWKPRKLELQAAEYTENPEAQMLVKKLRGSEVTELQALIDSIEDGVLHLPRALTAAEFTYLYLSAGPDKIEQFQSSIWETPAEFKEAYIARGIEQDLVTEDYLGVTEPDDYLNLMHYWECFRQCTKNSFEEPELAGLNYEVGVLASYLEPDAILLERQGDHRPNYIPTYHYGGDGITHGYTYDLQEKKWWKPLTYVGDGDFFGDTDVWGVLYSYIEEYDCLELDVSQDSWSGFSSSVEDSLSTWGVQTVCAWVINLTLTGYLNQFGFEKLSQTDTQEYRRANCNRAAKDPSFFVSDVIYPPVMLPLKNNFSSRLSKIDLERLASDYVPAAIESKLSPDAKKVLFESGEPSSSETFWIGVADFAKQESEDGRPWLAVLLAFGCWDWRTEQGDELALKLIAAVDDDFLPKFVRAAFNQHSKTRYDDFIKM